MISIANLGKSYGDRTLFAGVSTQLNRGERYGLVGANGSGKTTLLNILSGEEDATQGHASVPKDARLGVLRQDHFKHEDQRIVDVAMMGNLALWHALEEREKILARAESDFDAHRFAEVEEIVQHNDGYTAEARAGAILEGLGIPATVHNDPLSTLSGGFKLRVLLAQVLASQPDVLLLDEPTNHLDIISIRWLELFLKDFSGPVVVISSKSEIPSRSVSARRGFVPLMSSSGSASPSPSPSGHLVTVPRVRGKRPLRGVGCVS